MAKRKTKKPNPKLKPQPSEELDEKRSFSTQTILNIIGSVFILLLSGYIIIDILPNFGFDNVFRYTPTLDIVWLSLIGICSLFLIWLNRRKLSDPPISPNEVSSSVFPSKYPRLAKLPILGKLTSYFYNQGLWINLGLLGLLVVGAIIYFYKLSYYNWLPDEPLVMGSAKGFLESGTFYKWDYWTNSLSNDPYPRAWPHTLLVSQTINIFGSSEFTARSVSAVFGLITIPILYFVSNFFLKNRLAALLVTACIVFHPYTVHYFRRVRMYAVLIPIFLLLFYYCYQAITAKKDHSFAFFKKWPALKTYLNFHWGFILTALILLYFNYEIHKISLVILPAFLLFYLYLLITKREKRLVLILILALIPFIYFVFQEKVWESFMEKVSDDQEYNPIYWLYLFNYPVTVGLSLLMAFLSLVWSIFSEHRDKLIAVISLVITGIVLYVFLIEFNDHYRYVIHLIPFCLILSIGMLIKINSLIPNKFLKAILPVVILVAAISEYNDQFERVYYKNIEAQFPKQAYPTIVDKIQPNEAILGLFFADYYLAGMGDRIKLVEMTKEKTYSVSDFRNELRKHRALWVTWPTQKTVHIDQQYYQYLASTCYKYHGYGIDNSRTEVFYCQD